MNEREVRAFNVMRDALIHTQRHLIRMEAMAAAQMAIIAALVRSHPDPTKFAEARHSTWRRAGEPNADVDKIEAYQRAASAVLDIVEEESRVPLNMRPPKMG